MTYANGKTNVKKKSPDIFVHFLSYPVDKKLMWYMTYWREIETVCVLERGEQKGLYHTSGNRTECALTKKLNERDYIANETYSNIDPFGMDRLSFSFLD